MPRHPHHLPPHVTQVQVGELAIDLPGLLWQQRLQLVNMPLGSTAITLTARDLGNFMVHPLMVEAGATAVQVGGAAQSSRDAALHRHEHALVT
jgi:hypothetical protein